LGAVADEASATLAAHVCYAVPAMAHVSFRPGPTAEPLAFDRRVSAFGMFEPPTACEFLPEEVLEGGIAVLAVSGPLEKDQHWLFTSYEQIAEQLDAAFREGSVSAIVLKINSPGGVAAGMGALHKRIRAMRAQYDKPIYAYADAQACSAAYHLASACDEVWLPDDGEVGSVGVILCTVDESKALEKQGLAVRYVVTGERKADLHPGQPVTDEVIAVAQQKVDYLGSLFFGAVAKARGMTPAAVEALEAAVFTGPAAVEAGIADGVASFEEFLDIVRGTLAPSRATVGTSSAGMGQVSARRVPNEGKMAKILQLQKAAADAKTAYQSALKAFAAKPADKKLEAAATAALESKLEADKALRAASAAAKTTTVKHIKHEEKVTEHEEEEEEEDAAEEEEEEEEASDDEESTDGSTGASTSTGGSESEEEEEEEKAIAKAFATGGAGLHTPARLARLVRQVVERATGEKVSGYRALFGALDAMGQRFASVAKTEKRLAKLEAESRAEKVDAMLAKAFADGKIAKAEIPALRAHGLKDRGGLSGLLAVRPKVYRTNAEGEAFVPRADEDGNMLPGSAPSSEQQKAEARLAASAKSPEQAQKLIADYRARLSVNGAGSAPKH
jgi:signal peptide peptidase SppA